MKAFTYHPYVATVKKNRGNWRGVSRPTITVAVFTEWTKVEFKFMAANPERSLGAGVEEAILDEVTVKSLAEKDFSLKTVRKIFRNLLKMGHINKEQALLAKNWLNGTW